MKNAPQYFLLPPGDKIIARHPQPEVLEGARVATGCELFAANQGYAFPWGMRPEPKEVGRPWAEHRMGIGGLFHEKWFVTSDGRFGGAVNVPTTLPGSLRSCLLLDGGDCSQAENEGFAVVWPTSPEERALYRRVQLHAAKHVAADRGAIIVSPIGPDQEVYLGFVGRCLICPSPELISFPQAKQALVQPPSEDMRELIEKYFPDAQKDFSKYDIRLFPEWQDWVLAPTAARQAAQ